MSAPERRLPAHISEDDLRAVLDVVTDPMMNMGRDGALTDALRGLERMANRISIPFEVFELLESLRRADENTKRWRIEQRRQAGGTE